MISFFGSRMDDERLQTLLEKAATIIESEPGYWQVDYWGRRVIVITDEEHDRLRVMATVIADERLTESDRRIVLSANFDRAVDARYATGRGFLWSLFIHPLSGLSDSQFLDALQQVKELADNYGSTYCSSDLVFQGEGE